MNSIHLLNILQGRELLWSTSDAALKVAIMETISRCCAPPALPSQQQGSDRDQRGLLLGATSAANGKEEDFS